MLHETMEALAERAPTGSRLCRAMHLLKKLDVSKLQKGRNAVCGDEIHINCMEYQTIWQRKSFGKPQPIRKAVIKVRRIKKVT